MSAMQATTPSGGSAQTTELCKFHELGQCNRPRRRRPEGRRGRDFLYCENPQHNSGRFNRERDRLLRSPDAARALALATLPPADAELVDAFEADQSALVEVFALVAARAGELLERAEELTDSDTVRAIITGVRGRAAERVTTAQQRAAAEIAARQRAETEARAALEAAARAEADAQIARDALEAANRRHEDDLAKVRAQAAADVDRARAELAVTGLLLRRAAASAVDAAEHRTEEAEQRARDADDQVVRIKAEARAELDRVRTEEKRRADDAERIAEQAKETAKAQIKAAQQQARADVAVAQAETAAAQAKAAQDVREADARTTTAQREADAQRVRVDILTAAVEQQTANAQRAQRIADDALQQVATERRAREHAERELARLRGEPPESGSSS